MDGKDHPARILLVEDSLGVARALVQALSLYEESAYHVDLCASGEEALAQLHEKPYDLLISDFRLPGVDGLELLERVRQVRPAMRTILITAYGSPEVEARARELATRYLPKPFHLRELLRQVDQALSEPEAAERPPPPRRPARETVEAIPAAEDIHARHLKIVACDLDGTLIESGQRVPRISREMWKLLQRAKTAGFVLILVTGRQLDDLTQAGPYAELCEAIVAENGAVVYYPRRDAVTLPFGRLDASLVRRLDQLEVPVERGMAIVSTWVPHDEALLQALRAARISATVEYNRDGMMALPPGASKGAGLRVALQELGYSPRNVIAVGDAENDRTLFEMAELAVAVGNAEAALKAAADLVLDRPHGEGVAALLNDLLSGTPIPHRPRADRQLVIGRRPSGIPVHLNPAALLAGTLGIFGASGSGKSWLAGLLAEEALRLGYQAVIVDPEGDYRGLGTSAQALVLGGQKRELPDVADVESLCEWHTTSLVLDLSTLEVPARVAYVSGLMGVFRQLRGRRGRPHLLLVDEIQNLCSADGKGLPALFLEAMEWGGFVAVSYRPSLLPARLLEGLDHWLLTWLGQPEEMRPFVATLETFPQGEDVLAALPTLPRGQAYLVWQVAEGWESPDGRIDRFQVGSRATPHIRHLQKYLHAPLPAHKQFYFHAGEGRSVGETAANLWEFREALREVPLESLLFHLERDDFGRWLRGTLREDKLAAQIQKLGHRDLAGELLREALLRVVTDYFVELESLV